MDCPIWMKNHACVCSNGKNVFYFIFEGAGATPGTRTLHYQFAGKLKAYNVVRRDFTYV